MSNWPRAHPRPIIAMATRIGGALLLLISIAFQGQQTRTSAALISGTSASHTSGRARAAGSGAFEAAPGRTPVYRIKVRGHNGQTTLSRADLRKSPEEMNSIWRSQAGWSFEIKGTKGGAKSHVGF